MSVLRPDEWQLESEHFQFLIWGRQAQRQLLGAFLCSRFAVPLSSGGMIPSEVRRLALKTAVCMLCTEKVHEMLANNKWPAVGLCLGPFGALRRGGSFLDMSVSGA
jgi:hypothetical protein